MYHHSLPVVNGLKYGVSVRRDGRDRLPRAADEDEVRVFVFGESSVQGSPWTPHESPAAMLRDQLAPRLGDRRLTVVNMGRGSAMTLDTYYYLLAARRYAPDVVIFYQGTNDLFDGFEGCLPANHPTLHRLWRAAVRHSRLLWGVRVHGPSSLRRAASSTSRNSPSGPARCSTPDGFEAWVSILVETAQATGAEVIVTTPIADVAAYIEAFDRRYAEQRLHTDYCGLVRDEAERWTRVGALILASGFLETAHEVCGDRNAALVLGWLRLQLGIPPGIPPDLEAELADVDVDAVIEQIASDRDQGR